MNLFRNYVFTRSLHSNSRLLNYNNVKLTLFSKPSCGLCEEAKEIIDDVLDLSEFHNVKLKENLNIININKDKKWWDAYCFDIPVLHIEDSKGNKPLVKIMHHFREDEITEKLREFNE